MCGVYGRPEIGKIVFTCKGMNCDTYFFKMVYAYEILVLILTAHATVAQDTDQFSVNNAAQRFRDIVLPDQTDFQSSQIDRQEDNKFLPRQQTPETRYYNGRQNQNLQRIRDDSKFMLSVS